MTVTYNVGGSNGTIQLRASGTASDVGSYDITATPSADVTPDGQAVVAVASTQNTQRFTVLNRRSASTTYNLTPACTGTATGCAAPGTVTLGAGASTPMDVTYQTGALGTTGTVTLFAARATDATDKDSGWVSVSLGTAPAPTVSLADVNPGATVERSLCLTISAGAAAAAECGDLRIVHALPMTRTLNKTRTPTLLYSSAFSHPFPLVAATVTLPSGTATLDSVVATLRFGTVFKARAWWSGSDWGGGSTRRIVVGYDGLNDATGVYGYTLEVVNWYNSNSRSTTGSGQLAIVNRKDSYFGAGWWLAGLEQLNPATMVWVGGDGSVRQYQSVTTSVWAAPSVDRPDTLKWDGVNYVRYLPHGVRVKFDAQGHHVGTVNRLGHQTTFTYRVDTLTTVGLPPASSNLAYQFAYAGGRLNTLTAPPAGTKSRVVTLSTSGSRVTSILDADSTTVSFGYVAGDTNRIVSRADRRGTATSFSYDAAKKLVRWTTPLGGGQPDIITTVRPLESQGMGGAVDTALAYTLLDGPRTDAGDTTNFWLDGSGAPRRIRNGLGQEARYTRGDSRWPALVTRLQRLNGQVLGAVYDDRGNALSVTDSSTAQSGRYATTRYVWDRTWDFVATVDPPEHDSTVMAYDATNGNRLWQQDARGTVNRASFLYNNLGLLAAIRPPLSPPDSLFYDGLGNLSRTKSALGFGDSLYKDNVGRDTLIVSPLDAARTKWQRQLIAYNVMNRVTLTKTIAPAVTYQTAYDAGPVTVDPDTVTVQNFYDAEGNLDSLWRSAAPNRNGLLTLKTSWRYDPANRKVKAIGPDGLADSTVYDAAGNVVQLRTRRGHAITMEYDALNRLTRRIVPQAVYPEDTVAVPGHNTVYFPLYTSGLTIPADTATFAYDAVGDLASANNGDARIARTYNLNGTLAADTLRTRTWTGSDFTQHVYGLRFGYDLDGRRVWLKHPFAVAPRLGSTVKDSVAYGYAPNGALASVTDALGSQFQYFYDAEGRLDSLQLSGQMFEKRFYDEDGRLWRRVERKYYTWLPGDSGFVQDTIRDDVLAYDARGKVANARTWRATDAAGWYDSTVTWYSGLGQVAATQEFDGVMQSYLIEEFRWDALDNLQWKRKYQADKGQGETNVTRYQTNTGQLVKTNVDASTAGHAPEDSSRYDPSGNRHLWFFNEFQSYFNQYVLTETAIYYGADQRQRVLDRRPGAANPEYPSLTTGPFEEYRYDALGRRILVRSRHDSLCVTLCNQVYSVIERYVWDGDHVLYEIRSPGGDNVSSADLERDTIPIYAAKAPYGRVAYTHGLGIDRPLDVIRIGYSSTWAGPVAVVPHENWRGIFDVGSFDNGTRTRCTKLGNGTNSGDCVRIDWPGDNTKVFEGPRRSLEPVSWFGYQIPGQRDFSSQFYRRNRYYDAFQGRFTQEDPVGLAGGLNLYGFANGDPVNFSDPFGLCPPEDNNWTPACDEPLIDESANTFFTLWGVAGAVKGLARAGLRALGSAFLDKEATSVGTSAARGAYETAAAGGHHAGLLRNYAGRSASQIGRAVRSLESRAAQHLEKIAHPERFVENWAELTAREQQGLLRKWGQDAVRNAEEAEVLRGLLR